MSEENRGPIFQLLCRLNPGTDVDRIFINGRRESVESFTSFDSARGLVTFTQKNGETLVVDYRRIDAIKFD